MSKIVPLKDFGIPVNTAIPTANHIIAYYGPHPLTPSYAQAERIDCGPISALKTTTVNGADLWDVGDIAAQLPVGLSGSYDFAFTDEDANGNESDFSPIITVSVDTTVPPTLGQPVQL
jgi:hypothetical protein